MPRPSKATLAKAKVMADAGLTAHNIGQSLGHDPKSIRKWLQLTDFSDPELRAMIEKIKDAEINQLHVIGQMAREILLGYLDDVIEGKREINPISVTAILDRTFQQKQILSGGATSNLSVFVRTVELACEQSEEKIVKSIEEAKKPEDKD